jgi:hypothetical protein
VIDCWPRTWSRRHTPERALEIDVTQSGCGGGRAVTIALLKRDPGPCVPPPPPMK